MSIIEKLGLNGSLDYYDPGSAEIFEQQRNELLEALISLLDASPLDWAMAREFKKSQIAITNTTGRTWQQIKELI